MRLSAGPKLGVVFFCHLALSFDSSADHNKNYNIDTPQLYYMFLYNIQIFGDLWYKDVRTKIGPKNAFIGGFEVEPPSAKLGRWVIPATVGKCDPFFFKSISVTISISLLFTFAKLLGAYHRLAAV